MIDEPEITRSREEATAVIHIEVPRSGIQQVMEPAITEVLQVLRSQGVQPTGPLFSFHHRMDPAVFDFEVGYPVSRPVRPAGRVEAGKLPVATVARTVHHGGYEGLGRAWGELSDWMKENGHRAGPQLWERYLAGPETGSDEARWRTELNRTVVEGDG
ncbi:MAG: GyrI-like domain-containing protein [Gemmatimonadales bacterium]